MINRTYTITYQANTSAAIANTNALATAQRLLTGQVVTQTVALKGNAQQWAQTNTQMAQNAGLQTQVAAATATSQRGFIGLSAEVLKNIAAFAGYQAIVTILLGVGENISKLREKMKELAEEAIKFRRELSEIASITNRQPDDQLSAEVIDMGVQSNMAPDEIKSFLEQYYGATPAADIKGNIGRNLNDAQREDLKRTMAVTGARMGQKGGMSPKTAGLFSGLIPLHQDIDNPEQFAETFAQVVSTLNDGVGKIEDLTTGLMSSTGELVGEGKPFENLQQLAAAYSAITPYHAGSADEASTYVRKGMRELRDFTGDQAEGLETVGITPNDHGFEAIRKMRDYLTQQRAAGIGDQEALTELGFKDAAGRRAVMELTQQYDVMVARYNEKRGITGKQAIQDTDQFYATSKVGIARRMEAQSKAQDIRAGQKQEWLAMQRQGAILRMRNEGSFNNEELAFLDTITDAGSLKAFSGAPSGLEQRVDKRLYGDLMAQLQQEGLYDDFMRANNPNWDKLDDANKKYYARDLFNSEKHRAFLTDRASEMLVKAGRNPIKDGGFAAKVHADAFPPAAMQPEHKRPKRIPAGMPGGPAGPPRPLNIPLNGGAQADPNDVAGFTNFTRPKTRPIGDAQDDSIRDMINEMQIQTALMRDNRIGPAAVPRMGGVRA